MGNTRPKSEGKQPKEALPAAQASQQVRQGSTRHFAGKGGGWGRLERERGREPSQEDRGRETDRELERAPRGLKGDTLPTNIYPLLLPAPGFLTFRR